MATRRLPAGLEGKPSPGSLWAFVEQYLAELELHNYSGETVRTRRWSLLHLVAWLSQRGLVLPDDVDLNVLEAYQRHLYRHRKPNGAALSMRSQYGTLTGIQMFFKWMCKKRYLLLNPASELERPRAENRLPKPALTLVEVEELLQIMDTTDVLGLRDRAIFEVLLSTGMRRMEVCGLLLSDVDFGRGIVFIRQGKGKKDRYVPIGERALWWVERYLQLSRPALLAGVGEHALFLNKAGRALGMRYLTQKARKLLQESGIGKSGGCHLFRHTMATLLLEAGADTRYIQGMLGHADLSSTQIYTQLSAQRLKDVHTMYHPAKMRGKKKES